MPSILPLRVIARGLSVFSMCWSRRRHCWTRGPRKRPRSSACHRCVSTFSNPSEVVGGILRHNRARDGNSRRTSAPAFSSMSMSHAGSPKSWGEPSNCSCLCLRRTVRLALSNAVRLTPRTHPCGVLDRWLDCMPSCERALKSQVTGTKPLQVQLGSNHHDRSQGSVTGGRC